MVIGTRKKSRRVGIAVNNVYSRAQKTTLDRIAAAVNKDYSGALKPKGNWHTNAHGVCDCALDPLLPDLAR